MISSISAYISALVNPSELLKWSSRTLSLNGNQELRESDVILSRPKATRDHLCAPCQVPTGEQRWVGSKNHVPGPYPWWFAKGNYPSWMTKHLTHLAGGGNPECALQLTRATSDALGRLFTAHHG